ncbi:MAG: HD domain-containing protein [Clostridiales Family XIII bacterium]|jgi:tRNA nucleotidyltransferase (CCA-adding enzyme)|nr:HD domain-containing protein [Clostridiales Family XIII bacterium]
MKAALDGGMIDIPDYVRIALGRLRGAGFDAYCVGGCVRDLLLGVEPRDWDVATAADPGGIAAALAGFPLLPTGLRHGTVTALIGGGRVEITTFRVDGGYSDGRRPDSVRFVSDLREDLARRDFSMNAMALSADGSVIDYFGGREDIRRRTVRAVGDAALRFGEDALRILRALRFASALGFSIDEGTSGAARAGAARLAGVSAERLNAELGLTLCGMDAGRILRGYADVVAAVLPETAPMFGFEQHNRHHCLDVWAHTAAVVENAPATPVLRWAALLHDIGKPHTFSMKDRREGHFYGHAEKGCEIAGRIMLRLRFDNATRRRVLKLIELHDVPIAADRAAVRRQLNRLGEEALAQLLLLKRADNLAQAPEYRHRQGEISALEALMRDIIAEKDCFSLRGLAVDGRDMASLGLSGRAIGAALDRLLGMVMDGAVPNERDALLDAASRLRPGLPDAP